MILENGKSKRTFEENLALARARGKRGAVDTKSNIVVTTVQPATVVQLPVWPEVVRGVPNVALRSALFGVIRNGARAYLEKKEIHAQAGISIVYTGARLDHGDHVSPLSAPTLPARLRSDADANYSGFALVADLWLCSSTTAWPGPDPQALPKMVGFRKYAGTAKEAKNGND